MVGEDREKEQGERGDEMLMGNHPEVIHVEENKHQSNRQQLRVMSLHIAFLHIHTIAACACCTDTHSIYFKIRTQGHGRNASYETLET